MNRLEFNCPASAPFEIERDVSCEGSACVVYELDRTIVWFDAWQLKHHTFCASCKGHLLPEEICREKVVSYDHLDDVLLQNTVTFCRECSTRHFEPLHHKTTGYDTRQLFPEFPEETMIPKIEDGDKFGLIRNQYWNPFVLALIEPLMVEHTEDSGRVYHIPRRYTHWALNAIQKVFVLAYKGRSEEDEIFETRFLLKEPFEVVHSDCNESLGLILMGCDRHTAPDVIRVFDSEVLDVIKLMRLYHQTQRVKKCIKAREACETLLTKRISRRDQINRADDEVPQPKRPKYPDSFLDVNNN